MRKRAYVRLIGSATAMRVASLPPSSSDGFSLRAAAHTGAGDRVIVRCSLTRRR
jgi:hypothetical protein